MVCIGTPNKMPYKYIQIKLGCIILHHCFRPKEGSATLGEKSNDENMLGAEDEKQVKVTGMLTCCLMDNNLVKSIFSRH